MIWIESKPMIIKQTWMTMTDTSASYHSTISPIHTKEQIGVMKQEFYKQQKHSSPESRPDDIVVMKDYKFIQSYFSKHSPVGKTI